MTTAGAPRPTPRNAGLTVEAIVDSRADAQQRLAASASGSARVFFGAKVAAAKGAQALRAVDIIDAKGATSTIACDGLAVSGGWNPSLHLTCHLGGKPQWREDIAAFVPQAAPPGMRRRRRRERRHEPERLP